MKSPTRKNRGQVAQNGLSKYIYFHLYSACMSWYSLPESYEWTQFFETYASCQFA